MIHVLCPFLEGILSDAEKPGRPMDPTTAVPWGDPREAFGVYARAYIIENIGTIQIPTSNANTFQRECRGQQYD